jgi:integrase
LRVPPSDRIHRGEKAAKRLAAERTVRAAVAAYLAGKRTTLRPASLKVTTLYLTGPYFRPLHTMGITEVTHADIAARLSAIARKHSSNTAAAARKHVSAFFRWCMEEGWATANPVIGTRNPQKAKSRTRVLSDAELKAIWRTCADDEHGRIVRLLILLGSRPQEIGGMCWSEFDVDGPGTWELPESRSKNHRAHLIDLPPAASSIIATIPQRPGRDQLFGSRAKSGFTLWAQERAALDQRLVGEVKPWQLRDLRRTVATRMADIGIDPHVVEATLNHYSGHRAGVAGVYNRSPYRTQVKAALVRWSRHVLALVEGRDERKVIPLHT